LIKRKEVRNKAMVNPVFLLVRSDRIKNKKSDEQKMNKKIISGVIGGTA
jgi:hypothetical protein